MAAYDRHLLVLDAPDGSLGRHAMELVDLGVDVVYAQDVDEAHLLARQEGATACAALFACPPDPVPAERIVRRLAGALDGPMEALAPIGARPEADTIQLLRAAGLRLGLFDPLAFRELRFVASAVLRAGNPGDPRKSDRFPTALPAHARLDEHVKDLWVHDISRGGAWLAEPFPFPVGSSLHLEVLLDGAPFTARAVVVSRRTEPDLARPDAPEGMGVQFVEVDDASLERLRAFLRDCTGRYQL